jgi:threonine synthase
MTTLAASRPERDDAAASLPPHATLRCLACGQVVPARWQFSCAACGGQLVLGDTRLPALDAGLVAGRTPLIRTRHLGAGRVWLKDEGRNPSGSFKDRTAGAAVVAAHAQGARGVSVYSCGNAGAAAAAAAARLGLRCLVLALPSIGGPALAQLQAYGATVVPLDLDLATLWTSGLVAVLQDALWRDGGWFPLNRLALPLRANPYYLAGCASLADEVVQQLGAMPRAVVAPAGSGDLLLGLWQAFLHHPAARTALPRMIAAQATGAAPLVQAWQRGAQQVETLPSARTIASGIEMVTGSAEALAAIRSSGGSAMAVDDGAIAEMMSHLARREGVYAAPEGAAAVLVASRLPDEMAQGGSVVAVMTASGLKDRRFARAEKVPDPCAAAASAVLAIAGRVAA